MSIDETRLNDVVGRFARRVDAVGRMFSAVPTVVCVSKSRSEQIGCALGVKVGEAHTRSVTEQGRLTRIRRAAETPFNAADEARI
jgi:hypothetical protein